MFISDQEENRAILRSASNAGFCMNSLYFLLLALFWSLSFTAIKITVLSLPPGIGALLRVLIAQVIFTGLFLGMRTPLKVPFQSLWRLWIVGIFLQGLPFFLLFSGECTLSPALASIINSSVGAWALLFSVVIFKDYSQATFTKISGLILGVLGLLIIFWPDLTHQGHENKLIGVLSVTGMAMSYAFGALLNQRLNLSPHKVAFKASLWQQHWGSLLFLLVVSSYFEKWPNPIPLLHNTHVILALLYLGLFSTTIAWFIYVHLINTWGAVRASTVLFVTPILAIIWDKLFSNLTPSLPELEGVVVILLGIGLIQFSRKAKSLNANKMNGKT